MVGFDRSVSTRFSASNDLIFDRQRFLRVQCLGVRPQCWQTGAPARLCYLLFNRGRKDKPSYGMRTSTYRGRDELI